MTNVEKILLLGCGAFIVYYLMNKKKTDCAVVSKSDAEFNNALGHGSYCQCDTNDKTLTNCRGYLSKFGVANCDKCCRRKEREDVLRLR